MYNKNITDNDKRTKMTYNRLMNLVAYGGFPSRPSNISPARWRVMIKRVYTDLGKKTLGVK